MYATMAFPCLVTFVAAEPGCYTGLGLCVDWRGCVSHKDAERNSVVRCIWPFVICMLKGEVHPKMKVSYLVEFGTLS